jgi:hypothetical protein
MTLQMLVCLTQENSRMDIAPDYTKNPCQLSPQNIKKIQVEWCQVSFFIRQDPYCLG